MRLQVLSGGWAIAHVPFCFRCGKAIVAGMKYRLLGIDVDGTLLDADHRINRETIDAVTRARAKGMLVCLATGRSYGETIDIWRRLELAGPFEPMVVVGGAMVSEPDTGRTLFQKSIPMGLACEFADALATEGHSAMALVDRWRVGWDYLLCETGDVHTAVRDWFDKMDVRVRRVGRLGDATNAPRPLRINVVVDPLEAPVLEAAMKRKFDGRLDVHAIVAPNYGVTIVEGFTAGADKWNALKYVAQGYRIPFRQIAAIGDDVNDLSMIRRAGFGVAMAHGAQVLRDAADCIAEENVAAFVLKLIDGQFD